MKTAPPKRFGCRSSKVVAAIQPEEPFEFVISAEKSVLISVKTFLFFFGDHLFLGGKSATISDFGGKIRLNFGEDLLFFGDHLFLGEKPPQSDSRAKKIWVKVAYSCLNLPKKPPPFTKSGLRACAGDHELIPHIRAASFCTFWQLHLYSPSCLGQRYSKDTFSSVIQKTS